MALKKLKLGVVPGLNHLNERAPSKQDSSSLKLLFLSCNLDSRGNAPDAGAESKPLIGLLDFVKSGLSVF